MDFGCLILNSSWILAVKGGRVPACKRFLRQQEVSQGPQKRDDCTLLFLRGVQHFLANWHANLKKL